jgi:hypothetical protein
MRLELTMRFIVLLSVYLLSACQWRHIENVDQVVWSDDNSQQAYTVLMYEERSGYPLDGSLQKRDFRHQIFVQNEDGTARRSLTGERVRKSGNHLYFMKRAGYVMVDVFETSHQVRFDVIRLSGQQQTLLTYLYDGDACDSLEVIPSPDGALIAVLEQRAAGSGKLLGTCVDAAVLMTLYDAGTLTPVNVAEWQISDPVECTWTPAGYFMVYTRAQVAWSVGRDGVSSGSPPGCSYPKTTSSPISSDGRLLAPAQFPAYNNPLTIVTNSPQKAFGCQ